MHINSVEQGAGYFVSITADLNRVTLASLRSITKVTARAWVHRGDKLEASRKFCLVVSAGDGYFSIFNRFA